jgi:hypothetical protein
MKTQINLFNGLRLRLITLLQESAEIFMYLRPWLLKLDKNEQELFGVEHPLARKTEQQLLELKRQNEIEITKVLGVIENQFFILDAQRVFIQDPLMELPEKVEKKPKNWLTEKIEEEQYQDHNNLMRAIDF